MSDIIEKKFCEMSEILKKSNIELSKEDAKSFEMQQAEINEKMTKDYFKFMSNR